MQTSTTYPAIRFFHHSARLTATAALLLASGCSTGQIGGEVATGGESASDGCEITAEASLAPNDETSIGVTGAEAIAMISGGFETSLEFLEPPETSSLLITPSAGITSLNVQVVPDETSIRLLSQRQKSQKGQEPALAGGSVCSDIIAVDAAVSLSSEDGSLDENVQLTFRIQSKHLATASHKLPLDKTKGQLAIEQTEDETTAQFTPLNLELAISGGALGGSLDIGREEQAGESVSFERIEIATFPAGNGCLEGVPVGSESDRFAQAEEALLKLNTFDVVWTDGTQSKLIVDPSTKPGCLLTQGPLRVVIPALVHVQTDDEAINGKWELEGQITFDESERPAEVTLLRQAYLADVYAPGTFADESGISKFSVDDSKAGSFSFSLHDDLRDEHPASGELTVMEVSASECETGAQTGDGESGGSSAGCGSGEAIELGGATFVAADPSD